MGEKTTREAFFEAFAPLIKDPSLRPVRTKGTDPAHCSACQRATELQVDAKLDQLINSIDWEAARQNWVKLCAEPSVPEWFLAETPPEDLRAVMQIAMDFALLTTLLRMIMLMAQSIPSTTDVERGLRDMALKGISELLSESGLKLYLTADMSQLGVQCTQEARRNAQEFMKFDA